MIELTNGSLRLQIPLGYGPRVAGLWIEKGKNILAELPGMVLDYPGEGTFYLYGGHRLWRAPEVKALTYVPDNNPVDVHPLDGGIRVTQPVEAQSGLQKSLEIQLNPNADVVSLVHTITNTAAMPTKIAPWAITQVRPGGTAILPHLTGSVDPDGVLPNRALHLWPYTDIRSPYIRWGNAFTLVRAEMGKSEGPLKIGARNPLGWLGYWIDETLFVIETGFDPQADYPDGGSSSEIYCAPAFLELEMLGGLQTIGQGEAVALVETWRVFRDVPEPVGEAAVGQIVSSLGLMA